MYNQSKTSFLFYLFTLFLCFNVLFLGSSAAQVNALTILLRLLMFPV